MRGFGVGILEGCSGHMPPREGASRIALLTLLENDTNLMAFERVVPGQHSTTSGKRSTSFS